MSDVGTVWLEGLEFLRRQFFRVSLEEGILGDEENLIKSCNDLKDTDENERCRPTWQE